MRDILTIRTALERSERWYAADTALIEDERALTYSELIGSCRRVAAGFRELGACKGDRIAFLCKPSIPHTQAYYAGQFIGAITVNLHYRESMAHQLGLLQRIQPTILVYDQERAAAAQELSRVVEGLSLVQVGTGPSRVPTLNELLGVDELREDIPLGEDDPALIQLSSGSTGVAKALVHSHGSVLHSWAGGVYMWNGVSASDRFLNGFAPSFSVWLVHPGTFLNHGAAVVFSGSWDPAAFLDLVEGHRVTTAALTPTQWRSVLAANPESRDLKSLRMAAYLGEKISPEHLRELTERVCPMFCSFYGMSECLGVGGCVIRSPDCLARSKWGSVGKPTLNSDLRVIEPGGCARDSKTTLETGELVVRAASFASKNWGDPSWLERVLTSDGWYRTGDMGFIDEDGYVFLTGRSDNLITTGGIKVAAEEVEAVLHQNPDLSDVTVIGLPDETWGQRIVAIAVARSADVTATDLDRWCIEDGRLAGFKRPKEWRFVSEMPQNSVGKKDRNIIKAMAANGS